MKKLVIGKCIEYKKENVISLLYGLVVNIIFMVVIREFLNMD